MKRLFSLGYGRDDVYTLSQLVEIQFSMPHVTNDNAPRHTRTDTRLRENRHETKREPTTTRTSTAKNLPSSVGLSPPFTSGDSLGSVKPRRDGFHGSRRRQSRQQHEEALVSCLLKKSLTPYSRAKTRSKARPYRSQNINH